MVQDLIEAGKVVTDGLVKNSDHKAFKQPLPEYEKGESSKAAAKKNHDAKISYAYANTDNVIGMLEPVEYICMASSNNDNWLNYDAEDERPKVVLRTRSTPQDHIDTRPKVVL